MTRADLLAFLRRHRHAVQASVHGHGAPQAAVVGVAVTDRLEVVFDTLGSTRKAANLRRDGRIALVFGGSTEGDTATLQLEGAADEPDGTERQRLVEAYLAVFPDGVERQAWPGLTYLRVRPDWIRYSDFATAPPRILEWDAAGLARLP